MLYGPPSLRTCLFEFMLPWAPGVQGVGNFAHIPQPTNEDEAIDADRDRRIAANRAASRHHFMIASRSMCVQSPRSRCSICATLSFATALPTLRLSRRSCALGALLSSTVAHCCHRIVRSRRRLRFGGAYLRVRFKTPSRTSPRCQRCLRASTRTRRRRPIE